jgi:hypothetical protein
MELDAVCKYAESVWKSRADINSQMDELASYVYPDRKGFSGNTPNQGDEGRSKIWDSTPEEAAQTLSAALDSMLTNPATDWLAIDLIGNDEDKSSEHDDFINAVTRKLLDVFNDPATGFQNEVNAFYLDLPVFAWAVLLIQWKDGKGIRFRAISPSQCAIAENADGRVDTVVRRYTMTAPQILEEFGKDSLNDAMKTALESQPMKAFSITHIVMPCANLPKEMQIGKQDFPFISIYFHGESKHSLHVGGFEELPYMVPRWSKRAGEVYGRGPGHAALPDIRVLNRVAQSELIGAEKQSDPPLLIADEAVVDRRVRTHAGGITYYRPQGQQGDEIRPLPVNVNLQVVGLILEQKRNAIRAAFLNDRIQLVGGPQMTATEVMARERKQMLVLGPVNGRLESEFLGPTVDRVFLLLVRNGEIEAPESMKGREIRARYLSPISRSQKQGQAEAFSRAMQYLAPLASIRPEIMQNFDADAVARDTKDLFGFPGNYMRSWEDVQKEREAQAQMRQEQMAMQAAGQIAGQMEQERQTPLQGADITPPNRGDTARGR